MAWLYIVSGLPYAGKSVLSRELVRRFGFGYASVEREGGVEPVLIYVDTPPAVTAERRLRNLSTQERAHLEDVTVHAALSMFEEPAIADATGE
jgi:hypothetical protein